MGSNDLLLAEARSQRRATVRSPLIERQVLEVENGRLSTFGNMVRYCGATFRLVLWRIPFPNLPASL